MSNTWQESWEQAIAYWTANWRAWLGVGGVITAWLSVVFLSTPSLSPFVFMAFEPINSKSTVKTYHANLTALSDHVVSLAIILAVTAVLGTALLARMLSRRTRSGRLWEIASAAISTGLSVAALAALRVPIGGDFLKPGPMAIRFGLSLLVLLVVVPWIFWLGPLKVRSISGVPGIGPRTRREVFFLAWTWLVGLVVAQLLSASIAWTTTSDAVGSVVLAILIAGVGLLHQSVAYFYCRPTDTPKVRSQAT